MLRGALPEAGLGKAAVGWTWSDTLSVTNAAMPHSTLASSLPAGHRGGRGTLQGQGGIEDAVAQCDEGVTGCDRGVTMV